MRAGAAFTPYAGTSSGSPGGRLSTSARRPSTSCAVSAALAPEYCRCGAATTTSHPAASATSASSVSPGERIPSSLVMSTRMSALGPLRRVGAGVLDMLDADPAGEAFDLFPAARAQAATRDVQGTGCRTEPRRLPDVGTPAQGHGDPRRHRVARAAVVQRSAGRPDQQPGGLGGDEQRRLAGPGDQHRLDAAGDQLLA